MTSNVEVLATNPELDVESIKIPTLLPLRLDTLMELRSLRTDINRLNDAIRKLTEAINSGLAGPASLLTANDIKGLLVFTSLEKDILDQLLTGDIIARIETLEAGP